MATLALNHPSLKGTPQGTAGLLLPLWQGIAVFRTEPSETFVIDNVKLKKLAEQLPPQHATLQPMHWLGLLHTKELDETQLHFLWDCFALPAQDEYRAYLETWTNLTSKEQCWLLDKEFSFSEWKNIAQILFHRKGWMQDLLTLQGSRQQVRELVELVLDLPVDNLPAELTTGSITHWLQTFHKMRYPHFHERQSIWQQKVSTTHWPKNGHVKWVKQGDQTGLEIKLFVTHAEQLNSWQRTVQEFFK